MTRTETCRTFMKSKPKASYEDLIEWWKAKDQGEPTPTKAIYYNIKAQMKRTRGAKGTRDRLHSTGEKTGDLDLEWIVALEDKLDRTICKAIQDGNTEHLEWARRLRRSVVLKIALLEGVEEF